MHTNHSTWDRNIFPHNIAGEAVMVVGSIDQGMKK